MAWFLLSIRQEQTMTKIEKHRQEDDALRSYFDEIKQHKLLTFEEELELSRVMKPLGTVSLRQILGL